jgi:hypothetical protein
VRRDGLLRGPPPGEPITPSTVVRLRVILVALGGRQVVSVM